MIMNYIKLLITVVAISAMVSCTTTKDNTLAYFKDVAQSQSGTLPQVAQQADIRLVADDEISITISSMVPEATAMFNAPLVNNAGRGDTGVQGAPRLTTYIVDRSGNIELPVIGKLSVAGKTTAEVEDLIKARIASTVKDPFVKVELQGYYVNVLGEVKTPQRICVNRERYSVLDALAACGDLTEFAERSGVMVIRDVNGTKTYNRINLADTNVFASPCFYLQQNDVVYVEPNAIKIDNSKYNQNNAFKLSVISTIVSASSVVASLVIALLIKK